MIKHLITNHPNFEIASFKEYVNNVLVKERHYDDKGELNGLFYENEKHHEKFYLINRKRIGLYQSWHPNGKLREQCTYNEKGEIEGLYQRWHDNGQLYHQYTYNENGEREGLYQCWYDNGQLSSELNYSNGKLHGHYTSFNYDGSPLNSWLYHNGKKI